MVSSLQSVVLLLGLLLPLGALAQTPPDGAMANRDKCLGYDLEYKKYPKPVIAQVQADMYQLYHLDSDWKKDAGRSGKPLNDGILGPITWSWMQRFCSNFALDSNTDVAVAFPARAMAIAEFSEKYRADADTLISKPFALWAATHFTACDLDTHQTLAQGDDQQLQALVRCYLQPPPSVVAEPEPPIAIEPFQLYVLREDDFAAMSGAVAKITAAEAVVDAIKGEEFPDKLSATTKVSALLADLPEAESKKIADKINAGIVQYNRYLISDQALNSLAQQGISDALFSELSALRDHAFSDQAEFTKVIVAAIKKSNPPQTTTLAANEQHDSAATSSAASSKENIPATATNNTDKLALQIQIASQTSYFMLSEAAAEAMHVSQKPLAAVIIKLLETLKDIEYPTAELLQLAIKNKIFKASGICKLDKSNTVDTQLGNLDAAEKAVLFNQLQDYFKDQAQGPLKYCNEDHVQHLGTYFNQELLPILEQFYSEPMPEYTGKPILWDGSHQACGCVPKEIQTMAYGIFPYWKTTDDAQVFDFSTFNRVAYFGLTVSDTGKLNQINNRPGVTNLLIDNSDNAKAFIREARRYGSKVDWIIEKEFSLSPELSEDANLKIFFDNLEEQLLTFLSVSLTDAESRLRPWLTLGLAGQPVNGDGVTFYFKNYPKSQIAKDRFDNFFKQLKTELTQRDKDRNRFHSIKHNTYLNIMVKQSEFLLPDFVFGSNHIDLLTGVNRYASDNLSIPEVQEKVGSLAVLILEDPYYSALDEIYAVTNSINRDIVVPLMFTDYAAMSAKATGRDADKIDERQKRLEYIHESFGGGGFWPMLEYNDAGAGKDYTAVNSYIGTHFSPGYSESLWNETLCGYRWTIIAIMNIWLLLALAYVLIVFYIYPHRCKKLPIYIRWLPHPITVICILLPPIIIWEYLIAVDPLFNIINLSSLLGLILIALAAWAGLNAIKALKEQKPNRNLLQYQKQAALPQRQPFGEVDDGINRDEATEDDVNYTGDTK
ncbi:hypothetical protein [Cellvibrio sp. NN19]|uniref:hypothetical protein n=1 Tax=Cellvibrio chitinivorans TaxID=3102792 RepID=UPI002B418056|nr:hypothetical protein [Cellvibrio sp. NN19]